MLGIEWKCGVLFTVILIHIPGPNGARAKCVHAITPRVCVDFLPNHTRL